MRKLCIAFVALFFAASAFFVITQKSAGKTDKFKRSERAIANRYIVVLDEANLAKSDEETGNAVGQLASEYHGNVDKVFISAIKGYSVEMSENEALRLSDDPRVKYVEEDGVVDVESTESNATWGISRIDQRNYAYPLDSDYNFDRTGSGVNVYVIDTGILTTHPDFGGRAFDAFDASHDNTPISDCNGHGTHVAGTIGSNTFGVAKGVSLYSVKVFPCWGGASVSDVISGVDWVSRHAVKPAVANMSLGGAGSQTLEDSLQNLINSGVTVVVAAGNDSSDACNYSPSHLADAITVGMTDQRDYRDDVSNYGPCVDVFAPGAAIVSTWNQTQYPTFTMSGTSTAAPHVAGVAALYLEANPNAAPAEVSNSIASNATPNILSNIGTGSPNLFLYSIFTSIPGGICSGSEFDGSILTEKSLDYQSSSQGFAGGRGTYKGNLTVPKDAQFLLSLERKKGGRWTSVASSQQGTGNQTLTYNGSSGTYRWKISSVFGAGEYALCAVDP